MAIFGNEGGRVFEVNNKIESILQDSNWSSKVAYQDFLFANLEVQFGLLR